MSSGSTMSVVLPLAFPTPLAGPPRSGVEGVPTVSPVAVTGGGLVAVVDEERGIRGVWSGDRVIAGELILTVDGVSAGRGTALRADSAGWERTIPLGPAGRELVERGVLLDSATAVLVAWTLADDGHVAPPGGGGPPAGLCRLGVEILTPGGEGEARVTHLNLHRSELADAPATGRPDGTDRDEATGVAILPPGTSLERPRPRLAPPAARERQRREGRAMDSGGGASMPALFLNDVEQDVLRSAIQVIDGVATGISADGRPYGPFLLGVEDGRPRYVSGTALAEIGIAAALSGRPDLAWAIVEELMAEDGRSAATLPVLYLAVLAAKWSGDPHRLHPLRELLQRTVNALFETGETTSPAAFPGPRQVLESFADAVEPLGGGWRDDILDRLRSRPLGPQRRSGVVSLPVLGQEAAPPPPEDVDPVLPQPQAFAAVLSPAHAPRRALHAARLVRAWIEGVVGADADAAYGRLRLSPDLIRHPGSFRLVGLRVGDARVELDCRLTGGACRLRVRQQSGGLPLNVVLALRLPFRPPVRLRVEDHPAETSGEPTHGGTTLSLQFPLDPERSIVIEEGP